MSAGKLHSKVLHLIFPHVPAAAVIEPADSDLVVRRRRRVENIIRICWVVIAVKSAAVLWAVHHYNLPFNPLWVIGPTAIFALLATALYLYWDE